jgi:methylenetetrahydrofolate reductase (NADPH)
MAEVQKCRALGINNILALRGDPPRSDEYGFTVDVQADYFQHADDLVKYIRQEYKDTFCVGVAGYPTPHPDSETTESEMKWLKVKCDAGADFIITQLFYDMDAFEKWVKECRAAGITVPIIPGVMPIQNFASFRRLVKLTGCPVPDTIMQDLEPIKVSTQSTDKADGSRMMRR